MGKSMRINSPSCNGAGHRTKQDGRYGEDPGEPDVHSSGCGKKTGCTFITKCSRSDTLLLLNALSFIALVDANVFRLGGGGLDWTEFVRTQRGSRCALSLRSIARYVHFLSYKKERVSWPGTLSMTSRGSGRRRRSSGRVGGTTYATT